MCLNINPIPLIPPPSPKEAAGGDILYWDLYRDKEEQRIKRLSFQ